MYKSASSSHYQVFSISHQSLPHVGSRISIYVIVSYSITTIILLQNQPRSYDVHRRTQQQQQQRQPPLQLQQQEFNELAFVASNPAMSTFSHTGEYYLPYKLPVSASQPFMIAMPFNSPRISRNHILHIMCCFEVM